MNFLLGFHRKFLLGFLQNFYRIFGYISRDSSTNFLKKNSKFLQSVLQTIYPGSHEIPQGFFKDFHGVSLGILSDFSHGIYTGISLGIIEGIALVISSGIPSEILLEVITRDYPGINARISPVISVKKMASHVAKGKIERSFLFFDF